MHAYSKIATSCAQFSLATLNEARERILKELETSAATRLVVGLQMISLQRTVTAVGIFSLFEANLQSLLRCDNGFLEAAEILNKNGADALAKEFDLYRLAVNVLKHGRGRSYDALILKRLELPFKMKTPDQVFFLEGDVGEILTDIEVDDPFVMRCAEIVELVYEFLSKQKALSYKKRYPGALK